MAGRKKNRGRKFEISQNWKRVCVVVSITVIKRDDESLRGPATTILLALPQISEGDHIKVFSHKSHLLVKGFTGCADNSGVKFKAREVVIQNSMISKYANSSAADQAPNASQHAASKDFSSDVSLAHSFSLNGGFCVSITPRNHCTGGPPCPALLGIRTSY